MKTKKQFLTLLLIGYACLLQGQTGVVVTYYDATTQGFNVAASGKLYFANDQLNIKVDGVTAPTSIPITIVRKITFTQPLSTATFGDNKNHLVLHPNPGSDFISISATTFDPMHIAIYALNGQLVHEGTYTPNEKIDISNLSAGLYLVQANDITLKFSKK